MMSLATAKRVHLPAQPKQELSERAQERQFTCNFLGDELQNLAYSYSEFRDAYILKGDYSSAMDCNSKCAAFKTAAHSVRTFGHVANPQPQEGE